MFFFLIASVFYKLWVFLEDLESEGAESLPLLILMLLQVHTNCFDVLQNTLNTPVDVAFLGLRVETQNVRSLLISIFKEVPAVWWSHLIEEVPIFIMYFFFFLFFLLFILLLLPLILKLSINMLLYVRSHSDLLLPFVSLQ